MLQVKRVFIYHQILYGDIEDR